MTRRWSLIPSTDGTYLSIVPDKTLPHMQNLHISDVSAACTDFLSNATGFDDKRR